MPARFTALILVTAFSGPRWGELAALRGCYVDLAASHGSRERAGRVDLPARDE
jgi:hypothetical protein